METLIATTIAVASHTLFFLAGLFVANRYNDKSSANVKDALERQYMRLRAHADADDPCKPYKSRVTVFPEGFEQRLRAEGQATAMLNRSAKAK